MTQEGIKIELWVRFEHDNDNTEAALIRLQEDLMDAIIDFVEGRDAYALMTGNALADFGVQELTWRIEDEEDDEYFGDEEHEEERTWSIIDED